MLLIILTSHYNPPVLSDECVFHSLLSTCTSPLYPVLIGSGLCVVFLLLDGVMPKPKPKPQWCLTAIIVIQMLLAIVTGLLALKGRLHGVNQLPLRTKHLRGVID